MKQKVHDQLVDQAFELVVLDLDPIIVEEPGSLWGRRRRRVNQCAAWQDATTGTIYATAAAVRAAGGTDALMESILPKVKAPEPKTPAEIVEETMGPALEEITEAFEKLTKEFLAVRRRVGEQIEAEKRALEKEEAARDAKRKVEKAAAEKIAAEKRAREAAEQREQEAKREREEAEKAASADAVRRAEEERARTQELLVKSMSRSLDNFAGAVAARKARSSASEPVG